LSVIIVGKEGFVAKNLINSLKMKSELEVIVTSRTREEGALLLDLSSPEKFDYSAIKKGDVVIHLAAISSPDICKKEYDMAYRINVTGTSYFISKCLEKNARVLFFSSDAVYGESPKKTSKPFDENSPCKPIGEYAEMKRLIEKEFLGKPGFKVFRPSYMFSREDKFTSYLAECAKKHTAAEAYAGFYRNTVYLRDVLVAVEMLMQKWDEFDNPIFNLCGPELISRAELAKMYRHIVNKSLIMKEKEAPRGFFDARAKIIKTKSLYLKRLLGNPAHIKEAMKIEFKEN
jgi:dTDP-4-dehydrorhamnose reductase